MLISYIRNALTLSFLLSLVLSLSPDFFLFKAFFNQGLAQEHVLSNTTVAQIELQAVPQKALNLEQKIDQVFGQFVNRLASILLWDVIFWDDQKPYHSRETELELLKNKRDFLGLDLKSDPLRWGYFTLGNQGLALWNADGKIEKEYPISNNQRFWISQDGFQIIVQPKHHHILSVINRKNQSISYVNLDIPQNDPKLPNQRGKLNDILEINGYHFLVMDNGNVFAQSQSQLESKSKKASQIATRPELRLKRSFHTASPISHIQVGEQVVFIAFQNARLELWSKAQFQALLNHIDQDQFFDIQAIKPLAQLKLWEENPSKKLLTLAFTPDQSGFWVLSNQDWISFDQFSRPKHQLSFTELKQHALLGQNRLFVLNQSNELMLLHLDPSSSTPSMSLIQKNISTIVPFEQSLYCIQSNIPKIPLMASILGLSPDGELIDQKALSLNHLDFDQVLDLSLAISPKKALVSIKGNSSHDNHPLKQYAGQNELFYLQFQQKTPITLPLIVLWLVMGATYFTFKTRFANIRLFKHAIDILRGKYDDGQGEAKGEVSHFQALTSALSATVGLGNIAGVAIAISIGGPGACFWLITAGFLGMSSKFAECTVGQKYRTVNEKGEVMGGAMHYLSKGLAELHFPRLGKFLAILFSFLCIGGSFGGGNAFQVKQSLSAIEQTIPLFANHHWLYGLLMVTLAGAVILGGIKRIAQTAEKIVPLMCGIYMLGCFIIIGINWTAIPNAMLEILSNAFAPSAMYGGFLGVLVVGFQRAAFSNEAGVGSAAIAHAAAKSTYPVKEGIVALLEPFIDTIVVCTCTALVIIITGAYHNESYSQLIINKEGAALTSQAMGAVLPWFPYVLSFAVFLFAFSTMISWSYYGERCWSWLFGENAVLISLGKASATIYRIIFLVFVFLGAVMNANNILDFSDLMILGMALPNILGLFFLSNGIVKDLREYEIRLQKADEISK